MNISLMILSINPVFPKFIFYPNHISKQLSFLSFFLSSLSASLSFFSLYYLNIHQCLCLCHWQSPCCRSSTASSCSVVRNIGLPASLMSAIFVAGLVPSPKHTDSAITLGTRWNWPKISVRDEGEHSGNYLGGSRKRQTPPKAMQMLGEE